MIAVTVLLLVLVVHAAQAAEPVPPDNPGLTPADICLDVAPMPPTGALKPAPPWTQPSGPLAPVNFAQLTRVPRSGYYVDTTSEVFR